MVVVNPDSLIDLCYRCRRSPLPLRQFTLMEFPYPCGPRHRRRCARRLFGCDAFTRAISLGQTIHRAATSASCLLWLSHSVTDDRIAREEAEWLSVPLLCCPPVEDLAFWCGVHDLARCPGPR